ncbi:unnamed protein product, partial [Urochloa humidicola]
PPPPVPRRPPPPVPRRPPPPDVPTKAPPVAGTKSHPSGAPGDGAHARLGKVGDPQMGSAAGAAHEASLPCRLHSYYDIKVGNGAKAVKGSRVTVSN